MVVWHQHVSGAGPSWHILRKSVSPAGAAHRRRNLLDSFPITPLSALDESLCSDRVLDCQYHRAVRDR